MKTISIICLFIGAVGAISVDKTNENELDEFYGKLAAFNFAESFHNIGIYHLFKIQATQVGKYGFKIVVQCDKEEFCKILTMVVEKIDKRFFIKSYEPKKFPYQEWTEITMVASMAFQWLVVYDEKTKFLLIGKSLTSTYVAAESSLDDFLLKHLKVIPKYKIVPDLFHDTIEECPIQVLTCNEVNSTLYLNDITRPRISLTTSQELTCNWKLIKFVIVLIPIFGLLALISYCVMKVSSV